MELGKTINVVLNKIVIFLSTDRKLRKAFMPGEYVLRLEEIQNGKFSNAKQKYFVVDSNDHYGLPAQYLKELEGRGVVSFPHKKSNDSG